MPSPFLVDLHERIAAAIIPGASYWPAPWKNGSLPSFVDWAATAMAPGRTWYGSSDLGITLFLSDPIS